MPEAGLVKIKGFKCVTVRVDESNGDLKVSLNAMNIKDSKTDGLETALKELQAKVVNDWP